MSHRIHNTEAFVLAGISSGEGSSYVRFYTRDLGLISGWVQGVQSLRSKMRYHVQPFSYSRISLVRGRDMWRVVGAEGIEQLASPLRDAERFRFLSKIFTLISRLVVGEEPDTDLFDEVKNGVILSQSKVGGGDLSSLEILLVLRVLFRLGYVEAENDAQLLLSLELGDVAGYDIVRSLRPQAVGLINSAIRASQL